jgi:tetratricopeptide (TPR) repeat protein
MPAPRCPDCNHTDVQLHIGRGTLFCKQCGYAGPVGTVRDRPLKLDPDEDAPLRRRAAELAGEWHRVARLDELTARWPAPIAHELDAFHALLASGKIPDAFYQLRDPIEVMFKLPALILARDLLDHAPEFPLGKSGLPAAELIRKQLLDGSPSLGHWRDLARDLAKALCQTLPTPPAGLLAPGLIRLFYQTPDGHCSNQPRQTRLLNLLDQLITWRNREIGHGGFRPDPAEQLDCLERILLGRPAGYPSCPTLPGGLARALAEAIDTHPWQGLTLQMQPEHGPPRLLIGADAIRPEYVGPEHPAVDAPLVLSGPTGSIDLAPYAAGRRCDICHQQDCFFYNGRAGNNEHAASHRYQFLDYRAAHPLERRWHQARDLVAEHRLLRSSKSPDRAEPNAELSSAEVGCARRDLIQLLDEIAFERRFLPPDYLNQALRAFLHRHRRGILWLSAPAHLGKTLFVRGLVRDDVARIIGQQQPFDHPLDPAATGFPKPVPVAALLIRREYRSGPGPLGNQLQDSLAQALNLASEHDPQRQPGLPQLDLQADDRPGAFIDWIAALRRRSPLGLGPDDPLLICLDGLDELPKPAAHAQGILDFLPSPDRLPPGLFLLLTSRPPDDRDCPHWIAARLHQRLGQHPDQERLPIALDHPGYQALLRDYLRRGLAAPIAEGIRPTMQRWLDGETRPEHADDSAQANALSALRDLHGERIGARLEQQWLDIQPETIDPKSASSPPAALLADQARALDALFDAIYLKADRRFLYLALLVDRLAERELSLAEVPQLVKGDELYRDYLSNGLANLGPKQADLARRVLLLLAAAERVHDQYRALDLEPAPVDRDFHGLPLDLLLSLLQANAPGADPGLPTPNLVYCLYRLKPVLGSWRGDAHCHRHFRIGLAGLTEAIANQPAWRDDLHLTHTRLAAATLDLLDAAASAEDPDAFAPGPEDRYLLHAAFAQVMLVPAAGAWLERIGRHPRLLPLLRAQDQARSEQALPAEHHEGIRWRTLALAWQRRLDDPGQDARLAQAGDWFARGWHHYELANPIGAIADYNAAVAIFDDIRDALRASGNDAHWSLPLRNNLARVLQNRGVAHQKNGDLAAAIADFDAAIVIREGIRDALRASGNDAGWSLALRNGLAVVLQSRGIAHANNGDLAAAIADYNAVVAIFDDIRDALRASGHDAGWSLPLRNGLAVVLQSRGNAHRNNGDLAAAIADYDAAIAIFDDIRDALRASGHDAHWSLPLRNDLARMLQNRGLAHKENGDLAAAIADYDAAIAIFDDIRDAIRAIGHDAHWSLKLRNDLAAGLQNRGVAHHNNGDLAAAIADFDAAVAIFDDIRDALRASGHDAHWSLPLRNDLARVLQNRGLAHRDNFAFAAAIADFDAAVAICEGIRDALCASGNEAAWSAPLRVDLARVYHHRAVVLGPEFAARDLAEIRRIADGLRSLGRQQAAAEVDGFSAVVEQTWSGGSAFAKLHRQHPLIFWILVALLILLLPILLAISGLVWLIRRLWRQR